MKGKKPLFLIITLVALLLVFGYLLTLKTNEEKDGPEVVREVEDEAASVVIKNLNIPWEIGFLTEKEYLITERPGRVLLVDTSSKAHEVSEVAHTGEGGLLGLAIHPNFSENGYVYLYYTYYSDSDLFNKVTRYVFEEGGLKEDIVIIDNIPASTNHDGGRIKFGPDEKLYITTGDAQNPNLAQDIESLAGKILRLDDDGSYPGDNPFEDSPVYTYGHRNAQGLSWDDGGRLWATEHGASGEDEVNLITAGQNYGWPVVSGEEESEGVVSPAIQSGEETWAPSGATIKEGKLYFAGLAGRAIYVFDIESKEFNKHLTGEFGRIRTINLGPDGNFYILTSNLDGRNKDPNPGDDRLIKIKPSFFHGSN